MSDRRRRGRDLVCCGLRVATVLALAMLASTSVGTVRADACAEPNEAPAAACDLPADTPVAGALESSGDVDAYRFVVTAARTVGRLDLTGLPADYDLYLADGDGHLIGQSVREGTADEFLELTLQPGTYFAYVQADPARVVDPSNPYTLKLRLSPPTGSASSPIGSAAQPPASGSRPAVDAPPCDLNEQFRPFSLQTGRPFSELISAPAGQEFQARFMGAWQTTMSGETVRLVVFPTTRLQYVWASMRPGDDAAAYRTYQIDGTGVLSWSSGTAFNYTVTAQEDGAFKLLLVRGNGSRAEGMLTPCGV